MSGATTAAQNWGPPFPILYNSDTNIIKEYGVFDGKIAKPSTFIIDKNGIIRWKYVGSTGDRPEPQTVLQQLQALDS